MPIRIDAHTLAVVPVEQFFEQHRLGHATAFVWERHEKTYLVTNWHVLTMVDSETGANLHIKAARPNRLRAQFSFKRQSWGKREREIALRDEDNVPLWFIHPAHKKVDIAVLPLPAVDDEAALNPINRLDSIGLDIQIGMDVFVLGYPLEVKQPALPVWKRGSIASEPDLARMTDNFFLVDTASRPGMSGAPVIRRSWGIHLIEDGGLSETAWAESKFVGIYSGRVLTKQPSDVQLGRVWPTSLIHDIIDGQCRDTTVF